MEFVPIALFALFFLAALIAVVGYGIWVSRAWLFGRGSRRVEKMEQPPKPTGTLLGDLEATERQIERFRRSGKIDTATYERLRENIVGELQQLTGAPMEHATSVPLPFPPTPPTVEQTPESRVEPPPIPRAEDEVPVVRESVPTPPAAPPSPPRPSAATPPFDKEDRPLVIEKLAAVVDAAAAFRLFAQKCEIGVDSIRAHYSAGKRQELFWQDIDAIVVRELPRDPPWEGKLLVDFIPSPHVSGEPLRLSSGTLCNYGALPGGSALTSRENLRKLANYIVQQNASVAIDADTSAFLEGKAPLRLESPAQLIEYDERFSGKPQAAVQDSLPIGQPEPSAAPAPVSQPIPKPVYAPPGSATTQTSAEGEKITPVIPPPPPASRQPAVSKPERRFADVISAFMEDKNIRWGELIGGLLIIFSSTALVASLWAEIAQIPILKFLIFNGVTAALFGTGLFIQHRWNLPNTSYGLFIIATLLVPLNFLAIAAFSEKEVSSLNPIMISLAVGACSFFFYMVYRAGRVIAPPWPILLAIGVLGPSLAPLLVRTFLTPAAGMPVLLALAALPLFFYGGTIDWMLRRARQWKSVDQRSVYSIFILLGVSTFATFLAFGFLLFKTGHFAHALNQLAPLFGSLGLPSIFTGLFLWKQVVEPELGGVRAVGTAVGLTGSLLLLAALPLAWPIPAGMVGAAGLGFAVFTIVAASHKLPVAQIVAAPLLILAFVIGYHATSTGWYVEDPARMLGAIVSIESAVALTPMFLFLLIASEFLAWRGRRLDSLYYRVVACSAALISLAMLTAYGFGREGDPYGLTWFYALYATGSFWVAWRSGHVAASWLGSALVLASFVQAFTKAEALSYPWQLVMLSYASLTLIGGRLSSRGSADVQRLFAIPMNKIALTSSILAAFFLFLGIGKQPPGVLAVRTFWLSLVWLAISFLRRSPRLFTAFHTVLTLCVVFAITTSLQYQHWFAVSPMPLLDPWTLQALGIGLTVLSLGWVLLRLGFGKVVRIQTDANDWRNVSKRLLDSSWPIDRVVTGLVLSSLVFMACYGVLPGIATELVPGGIVSGGPHQHALSSGSWILLAMLLVTFVVQLRERFNRWPVLAFVLALATAPLLLAGRWEAEAASASALCWFAAIYLVLGSVFLWSRDLFVRLLQSPGWPGIEKRSAGLSREVRALLIFVTVPSVVVLTLISASAALQGHALGPARESFFGSIGDLVSCVVPLLLVCIAFVGHAMRERKAGFAFSAGLVLNLTATLAYLLTLTAEGITFGNLQLVRLTQLNAVATASFALAWLSMHVWFQSRTPGNVTGSPGMLLRTQIRIGFGLNLLLIIPGAIWLFSQPGSPGRTVMEIGSAGGWMAFVLSVLPVLWVGIRNNQIRVGQITVILLAIGALVTFGVCRWDNGNWLGYHALLVTHAAVAWLTGILGWIFIRRSSLKSILSRIVVPFDDRKFQSSVVLSVSTVVLVTVLLALRATGWDPGRPWWSVGALLAIGVLNVGLGLWTFRGRYIYFAGMLFHLATTIWCLTVASPQEGVTWVRLVQFNTITSAIFAVALRGSRSWWGSIAGNKPVQVDSIEQPLKAQVLFWLVTVLLIFLLGEAWLIANPFSPGKLLVELGSLWGWLAVALTGCNILWLIYQDQERLRVKHVFISLFAIGALIVFSLSRLDNGNWLSYHVLLAVYVIISWLMLALGWTILRNRTETESGQPRFAALFEGRNSSSKYEFWTSSSAMIVVLLALPAAVQDPDAPFWAVGALALTGFLYMGIGRCMLNRRYFYPAAFLFNMAVTIWWLWLPISFSLVDLIRVNVVALVFAGLLSLVLESSASGRERGLAWEEKGPSLPKPASIGSVIALTLLAAYSLISDALQQPLQTNIFIVWLSFSATSILVAACLWIREARYPIALFYLLGFVFAATIVNQYDLSARMLVWTIAMIGGLYSVLTSFLLRWRERIGEFAGRLRIPERADSMTQFLVPANTLLATTVATLAILVVLNYQDLSLRISVAAVALLQTWTAVLLAGETRRPRHYRYALVLGVVGAVAWGWALLQPGGSGSVMNRTVVFMAIMAAMTRLYGTGMAGRLRDKRWLSAARETVKWLVALYVGSLFFVLGVEVAQYARSGFVTIDTPAIIVVAAALIDMLVTCFIFAALPGRDPLNFSERGRTVYVYVSEVLLALLFVHIRLTMPWLLRAFFEQYWPFIVMAVSFIGVGLSELFRRRDRLVLAEPLERTGIFLPLLPVLGFWAFSSNVHYSGLLLLVGFLYGALSIMRSSFGFSLAAAMAFNGGLWYWLNHKEGFGLLEHPQLWLIPAALALLASAYLNRDQLRPDQMTKIRYISLMTVYVSSTADMFITGVGKSPIMPLVLAGLSIAGVFSGIMLRVRSFLYLGTAFLLLALVSMIWHASHNLGWTWLWYVAGIVLGLCIITIFAMFEKKREDMLRVVDGLKDWEK